MTKKPQQKMPYQPGTVLHVLDASTGVPQLTESERDVLVSLGWQEGDPFPDLTETELGKFYTQQLHAAQAEALDLSSKAIQQPKLKVEITPIEQLPPDKQEEARRTFEAMLELRRQVDARRADENVPHIPEHLLATPGLAQIIEQQRQGEEPEEALPEKKEPELTESPPTSSICPHCRHDITKPPHVTPTQQDLEIYVQTLLAGTPFVREYSFLQGRLKIVFRGLTSVIYDLASKQAEEDWKQQPTALPTFILRRKTEYLVALSFWRLLREGRTPITWPEPTLETDLPQRLSALYNEVLVMAPLRKLAGQAYQHFEQLQHLLEQQSIDFFGGTGNAL